MNGNQKILMTIVLILLGVGLLMIYSTSAIWDPETLESGTYVFRQGLWMMLSLAGMYGMMRLDYHRFERWRRPMLAVAFGGLLLVLLPGIANGTNGAMRWLRLGPVGFQPSELAKLVLVIYMAAVLSRRQQKIKEFFNGFLPPVLVLCGAFTLIVIEPDFGTALLIFVVVFMMLVVAGIRLWHVTPLVVIAMPIFAHLIFSASYRLKRILAFLDPWHDPQNTGYQIIQSLISIGSGGLWGLGLGASHQKLFFLPERHTDFIFAVLCEELGFAGGIGVVLLFCALVWKGMQICHRAPDLNGFLLGYGIVLMIGIQAMVNIAVVTASMPTKGISLPFISYGGSSLFFSMLGIGILLNVAGQAEEPSRLTHTGARPKDAFDFEGDRPAPSAP